MSASPARDTLRRAMTKRPKYGNRRVVDRLGVLYDSQAERAYMFTLQARQSAGLIASWAWGPRFLLQEEPLITYRPDFIVCPLDADMYAVDVKGYRTKEFALKARLWQARYPAMSLVLIHNGKETELGRDAPRVRAPQGGRG